MEKFDVIVVGAGPAGLAAAYTCAKAGLKTIVFERGEYPGSKNVMGGVLYRQATEEIIPGFYKEAPLERPIVEQNYWFLTDKSGVKMGYRSEKFGEEPYNNFTVLRAKFDRWLAKQVEKAGALIINETVVEDLLYERDRVVGVRTDRPEGDLRAEMVIICEGVNSLLTQKAGLRGDIPPEHLAVAVKEIIYLPAEKIEDRFGLEKGQGAVIELIGDPTYGMMGTGFIYTNRESISIGVGALLSEVVQRKINPNELLEHMKQHPLVRPLIEGGESKEYLAHLIPEGGYKAMPRLYAPGVLVAGDSAMLVNGIHREGSNLAMMSGKFAAQTAIDAISTGDFSNQMLARYQERLQNSFVLQDLQKYQNATGLFEENPQYFSQYPAMLNQVMHEFFTVDNVPKKEKQKKMLEIIRQHRSLRQVAGDMFKLWRVLG
ncbi:MULTISPECIES: FAD-dependent oxidoreductase [unclassified Carboxydocella]|uniref:FAD-dependent oxidoreductase n=1 Tax=unclassified Carboxydocella TaxID=2685367 RepID=UPI0009AD91F9|nr:MULTISPECIES: FAD-dependent oxidoreductase [unclassified Carboxydocella]AVX29663.1 electron transfer flavoprotein-quinone oxidoreductase [Carboxydocella thermautotrophica]GAW29873.1 nitrogen fixation protein FixC [Carboxydocella sp. ULO1]GAW32870.1 nitrogen fixation protein FixC [Carboxydocella sp. JDF658]